MSQKWNDSQNKILETLCGNMVASASAGSGKTTVMLERIIRLIKLGQPIKKMVVLAYNISIAAEIKQKLKSALTELLQQPDTDKIFIGEQIDNIDSCNICTIDSFCSSLIKEYFQLIKIDTNFSIMTEVKQIAEFRRVAKEVLQDEKDNNAKDIYDIFTMFGNEEKMIQALQDLNTFISSLPNRENYISSAASEMYDMQFDATNAFKSFKKFMDKRADYSINILEETLMLASQLAPNKIEQLQHLKEIFAGIKKTVSYEQMRAIALGFDMKKLRQTKEDSLQANNEYSKAFYTCKKALESKVKWITEQEIVKQQSVCGKTVKNILDILSKVSEKFILYKKESGFFDFSDLTYWAVKVLEHDSVSDELKQRYTSVCIDEFQDANYCQDYILSRITNDNLFIVGDTKQSIYGFRLAEPTILMDKFKECQNDENSVAVRLNCNYRSDEFILDFVNKIFDIIMIPSLSGVNYSRDERLIAGMPYEHKSVFNDSFEIRFFVSQKQEDKTVYDFNTDIYDITAQDCGVNIFAAVLKEGEYIASKINELVGKCDIFDPKIKSLTNDGWRKVKFSDICILAKSRSRQLQQIIDVVSQYGIPIDSKSLDTASGDFYVNSLTAMLRVVDNDCSDAYLAAALVSPWGRMSYQELLEIRACNIKAEFFYEACISYIEKSPKLKDFFALIETARIKLATSSLHELASWLVYDNNFYDALGLERDGDNRKHIIKQYLDIIKNSKVSLTEYIAGLDDELAFKFTQYPDKTAQDTVSTATIHASKGLEYPIVFLADCNDSIHKRGDPSKTPILYPRRSEGIAIDYFEKENLNKTASIFSAVFKELKSDEEELEAMRVFYVALTRARNKLFISGNFQISMKAMDDEKMPSCESLLDVSSFADWILYVKEKDTCINNNFRFIICNADDIKEGKTIDLTPIYKPTLSLSNAYEKVLNYEYPHKNSLDLGIKYTVTEINEMDAYEDKLAQEIAFDYEKVDKALRGTNYHKVLENIDYRATDSVAVNKELTRMLNEGMLDMEEIKLVNPEEIAGVMRSEIMRYAAKCKHLREKKFMLMAAASEILGKDFGEEEILIQGAIDLVVLGDKTYVVDFKKTRKDDKQIRQTYSKQLNIYAKAVEEALNVKVDGKIIVEIGTGREIVI